MKKKLSLSELKVNSFETSTTQEVSKTVKGGVYSIDGSDIIRLTIMSIMSACVSY